MLKKEVLFFDLDGTIVDSKPGIVESVKYALKFFDLEENDNERLNSFIGPPLFDSFKNIYKFSDSDANRAVEYYRENYNQNNAVLKYNVYKDIPELLMELKFYNKKIALATAKPLKFAKIILEDAGLLKYFDVINGASMDETKRTKDAVILDTINTNNFKKEDIIMIGDRDNDAIGAKNNGIDILGVLWGYGDEAELKKAGCSVFAKAPLDILNMID